MQPTENQLKLSRATSGTNRITASSFTQIVDRPPILTLPRISLSALTKLHFQSIRDSGYALNA
jgi:hypothetical protein